MSKHTPGPWSINDWPQATTDIAIGAVGTPMIAKVSLRDVSINEQKANARLIAAAPELLEALNTWLAQYSAEEYEDCPEVVQTRAAIAKSTGGEA